MQDNGVTLTLRVTRMNNRNSWRAVIEELDISVPGITPNDAMYALGQCLSSIAHDCMTGNKNLLDLVITGE